MDYKSIGEKIINLKNADLELRNNLVQNGKLNESYNHEMSALHNRNANVLNEIIDAIGYPTIHKVGKEANEAAWLVIQHSIGQPEFMKKCVVLLENAVNEHEADPKNLAYLTDRIAVFEGKPQLYGTQFDWDENGNLSPDLLDDLIQVNERRKSIGLNSLEEQTEIIRSQAENENQIPPADFEKRKQEVAEWRKNVGWVKPDHEIISGQLEKMMVMKEIRNMETERTILRKLRKEDAEDFYSLNLDKEVLKYTGDQSFEDLQAAIDFLTKYDQYDRYGVGRLAVIDKVNSKFIGWCGLKYSEDKNEYDIGFRFYRKYWNKGFATETAKKCLDFGFNTLGIEKIVGRAMKANTASIRVLEKTGMTLKENFDFEGHEGVIYELTKSAYETCQSC